MVTAKELGETHAHHSWCPGCGDVVILSSVKFALQDLNLDPKDLVLVSGIGCGSKLPHFVKAYGFESLHGRSLPVATGIKLGNDRLTVIAVGGDGDGYGIGGNHFIHTMRRNIDITYLVQNNEIYGLTKGQTSPTSVHGYKSKTTPSGAIEMPINPLVLALAADATFVARGYAMDPKHLRGLIMQAVNHKGIALVDILQPCPTWRKDLSAQWFKEHTYKLDDEQGYDPKNKHMAYSKALEQDRWALGVLYKEDRPTYTEMLYQLKDTPLAHAEIDKIDMQPFFDERK